MTKFNNIETTLVQLGNRTDPRTGAVATPIILSTAYGRDEWLESKQKGLFDMTDVLDLNNL